MLHFDLFRVKYGMELCRVLYSSGQLYVINGTGLTLKIILSSSSTKCCSFMNFDLFINPFLLSCNFCKNTEKFIKKKNKKYIMVSEALQFSPLHNHTPSWKYQQEQSVLPVLDGEGTPHVLLACALPRGTSTNHIRENVVFIGYIHDIFTLTFLLIERPNIILGGSITFRVSCCSTSLKTWESLSRQGSCPQPGVKGGNIVK